MIRVAVTPRSFRNTQGAHQDRLRRPDIEVVLPSQTGILTEDELVALVGGCDALIAGLEPVTARVLDAGPLRVVVRYGTGMDNVDLDAARERGVRVGATPGANARSVAELTMALLLSLARNVAFHDRSLRAGRWERRTGIELRGRLLGLIGCGAVGREVAGLASAIGMRVVAHDPYAEPAGIELVPLAQLLARADAVSLHVPLTPSTRGLIDAAALRHMRHGALLVNTARGELVDEEALYAALVAPGGPGGAAIDAFTHEPPTGSPLLELDNVIASPHTGGATTEAIERMGVAAVEETLRLIGAPTPPPGQEPPSRPRP